MPSTRPSCDPIAKSLSPTYGDSGSRTGPGSTARAVSPANGPSRVSGRRTGCRTESKANSACYAISFTRCRRPFDSTPTCNIYGFTTYKFCLSDACLRIRSLLSILSPGHNVVNHRVTTCCKLRIGLQASEFQYSYSTAGSG